MKGGKLRVMFGGHFPSRRCGLLSGVTCAVAAVNCVGVRRCELLELHAAVSSAAVIAARNITSTRVISGLGRHASVDDILNET